MSEFQKKLNRHENDDPLFSRARIGVEAEAFLQTNLGQLILSRAEADIEAAYKELASADPFDTARIVYLQNKVRVARAVPQWLAEAVNEGDLAAAAIVEEEAYDAD